MDAGLDTVEGNMSWLDTARGAYVRSPRLVRNTLRPLMAMVPTHFKFGGTYRRWRERIARAEHDPAYAGEQQLASLRALLAKAYAGSPYYRDLIVAAFGPDFDAAQAALTDITRLPVLDKATLRLAGARVLAVPATQVDIGETSGSNHEKPFSFYLDKDRSAREMAFVYDAWSSIGFDEKQARACLRGFGLDPKGTNIHDWDPALRELRLSVFPMTIDDAAVYLDLIDRHQIRYLYGYASAIELFCRQMRKLDRIPRLPILGIMPISEPLLDHQRTFIQKVLGDVPFACFYGLSEKVLFATEVPGRAGTYDFNPLYGLAELVDNAGNPVTEPGREGRLIGTGFLSTGMPFIRYDTGDLAHLVALPSPDNGHRLRVDNLAPRRKPNYLIAKDGSRIVTIDLTTEHEGYFSGLAEFQFYQDTPGEVVFRYIAEPGGSQADAERVARDLQARSHGRLSYRVEPVARIVSGRNGKRAFIDQRLDISLY